MRAELDSLAGNDKELEDAFYTPMEFGTAGMRGVLGVGINRMNIYTVRQATEGLARFMDQLDAVTRQLVMIRVMVHENLPMIQLGSWVRTGSRLIFLKVCGLHPNCHLLFGT